jgi:hypothetical protein
VECHSIGFRIAVGPSIENGWKWSSQKGDHILFRTGLVLGVAPSPVIGSTVAKEERG